MSERVERSPSESSGGDAKNAQSSKELEKSTISLRPLTLEGLHNRVVELTALLINYKDMEESYLLANKRLDSLETRRYHIYRGHFI